MAFRAVSFCQVFHRKLLLNSILSRARHLTTHRILLDFMTMTVFDEEQTS
jgi:hypothetical protein